MKISSSTQYLSFFVAIGIILMFIFGTEREFTMPVVKTNDYDKMMMKNNKANTIKKTIVSTLEQIAYKKWAIDSLVLVEQKYESMDSVLIERLEDIKFEFGVGRAVEVSGLRTLRNNLDRFHLLVQSGLERWSCA